MKRILVCTLALCLTLGLFTGCDTFGGGKISAKDGYGVGEIGDTMSNYWFDFKVESAEYVDEYAGYAPDEGFTLVDTVVTIKNRQNDQLPMFDSDFWLDWGEDEDYSGTLCLDALDSTMMPMEFFMDAKQEATYHLVFEVPVESKGLEYGFAFQEEFLEPRSDDPEDVYGDIFYVFFTL